MFSDYKVSGIKRDYWNLFNGEYFFLRTGFLFFFVVAAKWSDLEHMVWPFCKHNQWTYITSPWCTFSLSNNSLKDKTLILKCFWIKIKETVFSLKRPYTSPKLEKCETTKKSLKQSIPNERNVNRLQQVDKD